MSIADIVIPTETVEYHDATFDVRGLSFADIGVLLRDFPTEVEEIFDQFSRLPEANSPAPEIEFAGQLVTDFIDVVALAIAMSANEVDQVEKIKTLPPAVLIDAINKIWNLTVQEAGGLGKLVGGSQTLLMELVQMMTKVRLQLTGSTDYDALSAS